MIAVCASRITIEYTRLYLDDFSHLRSYNLFEIGCHGCGLLCVVTVVARLLLRVVILVAGLLLCVVTLVARLLLRVVVMVTLSGCHGSDVSMPLSSRVILVPLDGGTSAKENGEISYSHYKNAFQSDAYRPLFTVRGGGWDLPDRDTHLDMDTPL